MECLVNYSISIILVGVLVAFLGLVMVQKDLRLLFGGRTIEAEVMDDYVSSNGAIKGSIRNAIRGPRDLSLGIEYRFKDDKGDMILGGGKLPLNYEGSNRSNGTIDGAPQFLTVKIRYLPGHSEINQLVDEERNPYWTLCVGLILIVLGFIVAKVEAYFEVSHRIKKKTATPAGMPVEPAKPQKQDAPKVLDFD